MSMRSLAEKMRKSTRVKKAVSNISLLKGRGDTSSRRAGRALVAQSAGFGLEGHGLCVSDCWLPSKGFWLAGVMFTVSKKKPCEKRRDDAQADAWEAERVAPGARINSHVPGGDNLSQGYDFRQQHCGFLVPDRDKYSNDSESGFQASCSHCPLPSLRHDALLWRHQCLEKKLTMGTPSAAPGHQLRAPVRLVANQRATCRIIVLVQKRLQSPSTAKHSDTFGWTPTQHDAFPSETLPSLLRTSGPRY